MVPHGGAAQRRRPTTAGGALGATAVVDVPTSASPSVAGTVAPGPGTVVPGTSPAVPGARGGVSPGEDVREHALVRIVSMFLVVVVAMRLPGPAGVPVGTLAALGLAPVLVPAARRFAGGRLLLVSILASVLCGWWLSAWSAMDHARSGRLAVDWTFHLVGLALGVAALLWARTVWRDAQVALFFGVGMVLGVALGGMSGSNPWKFTLSIPVSVLVLAVAWIVGRWWVECLALAALAAVSMVNDSRSLFGMFLMTAALVAWQGWARRVSSAPARRRSALAHLLLLGVLGAGVFSLGQSLMLEGALGEAAQQRSVDQIERSGSLLVGARPEMGAAMALVEERPMGFGLGVRLTLEEILVAKSGMAELGYDPNNGYVERYMFGGAVEVHSVVGDLWALTGLAGVVLAAVVVWVLLRAVATGLASRTMSALLILLCLRGLWDMFFGPLYSGLAIYTLVLGMALTRRAGAGTTAASVRPE